MGDLGTLKSVEYTAQTGADRGNASDVDSGLRVSKFSYTNVTAGAPLELELVRLPEGKVTVYVDLCRLVSSDEMQAGADLHLGYRAYVDPAGEAVIEDDNAFANDLDSGGGALDQTWPLPAAGVHEFNSSKGVVLFALVDTADIDAGATISGYVVWSKAGL